MKEDIKLLDDMLAIKNKTLLLEKEFNWIYLFTNENIRGYYKHLDFSEKNALIVTASGDHVLNAFLLGAKEIDAFDINPLAKYFVELKIAAIKSLTLEEFILFFYNKTLFKYKKYFLNKDTYITKIRANLNKNYQLFWDYVFEKYTSKELNNSFLFSKDYLNLNGLISANLYLQEENYNRLKEIVKNKNIVYHDLNIKDLSKINKKFDILIFSNIPAFLEKIYKKDCIKNFKELVSSLKKENSKVVLNYFYSPLMDFYEKPKIYDEEEIKKYFSSNEYEYIYFKSSEMLESSKHCFRLYCSEDKVLKTKENETFKKTY